MAAGMPGAGIGGIFYILSALLMPFRELARMARGDAGAGSAARWRAIALQVSLALGIVAALWLTGVALGWLFGALHVRATPLAARHATGSVLRASALLVSLGTLAVVLLVVQVARLTHARERSRAGDGRAPRAPRGRATLLGLVVLGAAAPTHADAQGTANAPRQVGAVRARAVDVLSARRAAADSAFAAGDRATAEREYVAVLAAAPNDSRAVFRLAQLRASRAAESARLYARYVAREPRDPWGHLALADALARTGRVDGALAEIDAAARLAPTERDVALARARILARAGRTDAAIDAYERRVAEVPGDAEAWRELAAERRRAGRTREAVDALAHAQVASPDAATARRAAAWRARDAVAVEPTVTGTRDSDGNLGGRAALALSLPLSARSRAVATASRLRAAGGVDTSTVDAASLAVAWRPRATLAVDVGAGVARVDGPAPLAAPRTTPIARGNSGNGRGSAGGVTARATAAYTPTGTARIRWRAPGDGPALDVRASRALVDATALLVRNGVVRDEGALQVETPLALGLRARGTGRIGSLHARGESNTRTLMGGALVRPIAGWGELSGAVQRIAFAQPTSLGYFAPRAAHIVEAATYLERESAGGVVLALDLGAGAQRVTEFGSGASAWTPALRGWARLDVPVGSLHAIRAELDAYDGGVAHDGATTGRWRWAAASLGLHLGL